MANYFVLQENNETAAYGFKVVMAKYKPLQRKNQREQYTVTGVLDVQIGPNDNTWEYGIKLYGDTTGNFAVTPGAIMTAANVTWGDMVSLATLFSRIIPPTNKLRFRDLDGQEYYVFFTGEMRAVPLTPKIDGENAYMRVDIVMRSST